MNLYGFCGADPNACDFKPQQPTPGAQPSQQAMAQAAIQQYPTIATGVSNFLYRVAARIGRQYVCPYLPGIGRDAGVGLALYAGLPALISLGYEGLRIEITAAALGAMIGQSIGEELQTTLCK